MNFIETIIAQGTPSGLSVYESLSNFQGTSLRIREHTGKAYPLSLAVQSNDAGVIPSKLSLLFNAVNREKNGLEYAVNFPTMLSDLYIDEDTLFQEGEELTISINSAFSALWNVHLSLYYENIQPLFNTRFINYNTLMGMRKNRVVKTSDLITLTGTGSPSWKTLSSFVGSYIGTSYYAICGGVSNYYQGSGYSPNVYPMILTGKFNGNRYLTLPMNSLNQPPDLCKDYFLTVSRMFGNIDSIPVIKGDEFPQTFFEMFGDEGGEQQFQGSLFLYELPDFRDGANF